MGDHNSVIEHIKNELTCAICLEVFEDPRTLNCLHTFCYSCLSGYIQSGKNLCPLCQTRFNIPAGGVSNLKKNHNIENIITVLQAKAKEHNNNNNNNSDFPSPSAPPEFPNTTTTTTTTSSSSNGSAPPLEENSVSSSSSGSIFDSINSILFTENNPLASLFASFLQPKPEAVVGPPPSARVLPFLIQSSDVPELLKAYFQSLWFLPSDFHESIVIGRPTAVFLPYWVFSIHTTTRYKATIPAKGGSLAVNIDNTLHHTHNNIICCGASEDNLESRTLISDSHLRLAQTLTFGDAAFSISGINPPYPFPILPSLTHQRIWAKVGQPKVQQRAADEATSTIRRQHNVEPNTLPDYSVNIDYEIRSSDMVCLPIFFGEYTYNSTSYKYVVDARDVNIQSDRPYGLGVIGSFGTTSINTISSWFS